MSTHYDADGDPINPRDVLDDAELLAYAEDQRKWTGHSARRRQGVVRDELGYVRYGDAGWRWEPDGGAA